MLTFLKDNAPWLGAAALMTFASSFGQTYFISLFAADIRTEFGLSHEGWGRIYMYGTLASAGLMLVMGAQTDRIRARVLAVICALGLSLMCIAMASLSAVWLLWLVILGLRFFGQGMLGHIAIVAIGRWYQATRGRALAVAGVGYSLGEAILPVLVVSLIGMFGWRAGWLAGAAVLILIAPVFLALLRQERSPRSIVAGADRAGMGGRHWTRGQMLRHWLFWVLLAGILAHPAFGTAFFFHQVHLVEDVKGWTMLQFASLMPLYVASSIAATFGAGWLVDKVGSGRLVPVYLGPLICAYLLFAVSDSLWVAACAMMLVGLSQGGAATILGAFWPEYYGTARLGAIKAVAHMVMVLGSAIGPWITGYALDAGVGFETQLVWMAAYCAGVSCLLAASMRAARASLVGPTTGRVTGGETGAAALRDRADGGEDAG